MKRLEYNGLVFICGCKLLPPKGYTAITLFNYVFTRMDKDTFIDYLGTERGQQLINHESMHIRQAETFSHLKWLCFYSVYIWQFLKAWPFRMSWNQAYKTICFELEAYEKQSCLFVPKSNWRRYIWNTKARKAYKV